MARSYASIALRIWSDDTFRSLTMPAQWLYLRLISDPRLSLAGVAEWNPKRLARCADQMTRDHVNAARAELEARRFICIDDDTDEVAVRSFMRNDKTLASQKTAVGVEAALDGVESAAIRAALSWELHRMAKADNPPSGLVAVQEFMAQNPPAEYPYPDGPRKGYPKGYHIPLPEGVADGGAAEPEPEPEPKPEPEDVPESDDSDDDAGGPETPGPNDRDDVLELLDHLDAKIHEVDPEAKLPNRTKTNADAARLLLDKDHRSIDQVKAAIDWALDDEFWRPNIRSMSKLREKYDTLRAQAQRDQRRTSNGGHPSAAERQYQISAERHERIIRGELGAPPPADDPHLWLPRHIEEAG